MPNSIITITFNSKPPVDSAFRLSAPLSPGGLSLDYAETFKDIRNQSGESQISTFTGDSGIISTASFYRQNFLTDYNNTNIFTVSPVNIIAPFTLTIEVNDPSRLIEVTENTTNGAITTSIDDNQQIPLIIQSVLGSEASTDPCNKIKLTVNTNLVADSITSPINQSVSSNPFVFDANRAEAIPITMVKDGVNTIYTVRAPKLLASYFDIDIVSTPNDATLTVNRLGAMAIFGTPDLLVFGLEFSLDQTTWQASNSWSGVPFGDGTVYIRDLMGCEISIDFTVDAFTPNLVDFPPECEISVLNSIRFKNDEEWSNCGIRKNKLNTLSYEEKVTLPKSFKHLFQTCDSPKTQIKSNYTSHVVTLAKKEFTAGVPGSPETTIGVNLLLRSDNAGWNTVWIAENVIVSNDFDGVADKVAANTTNGSHYIRQSVTKDAEEKTYTFSVVAKKSAFDQLQLTVRGQGASSGFWGVFDLTSGVAGLTGEFNGQTIISSSMTDEGSGYYRCSITGISDNSTAVLCDISIANLSGAFQYAGDNISGFICRNMQLSDGSLVGYVATTDTQAVTIIPEVIGTPSSDCTFTDINVERVVSNMNMYDVRDATVVIREGSILQIRFGEGNTYDPDTLLENGSYNLGQDLPSWLNVGDYLNVQGLGWALVLARYAPNLGVPFYSVALQLFAPNLSEGDVVQITGVYNLADFDRFEFTIPFDSFGEGCYQITVVATHETFPEKRFKSEWIDVKEKHLCKHHYLRVYNTEINEINWSTGIVMIYRMPYVMALTASTENEEDIVVLDTSTVPLENRNRRFDEMNLLPVPTMISFQRVMALSQDKLELDGLTYIKEGNPEERRIGVTNTYQVKANLVESDYVFKSASGLTLSEFILPQGVPIQINENSPGLLLTKN